MSIAKIKSAVAEAYPSELFDWYQAVCQMNAEGSLSDDEASALLLHIDARRAGKTGDIARGALGLKHSVANTARPSQFTRRRIQHARPHPERIERRRVLAASSPVPSSLVGKFTTAQLAVLRVVGDEVREKGYCDRSLAELAARAGVCRTVAQTLLRRLAGEGLLAIQERPQPGRKNLPNIVRIICRVWAAWVRCTGFKRTSPTANIYFSMEKSERNLTEELSRGGPATGMDHRLPLIFPLCSY